MDLQDKIRILGDAAKYDASCASSGSSRRSGRGGTGTGTMAGICHTWSDDGRCVSLLKVLQTNLCVNDCAYCVNRASGNTPRASFEPEELAELTIQFYRRNYIEGLFLSSGVERSPDFTMERMLQTVRILRERHRFGGYIHAKAIPGASPGLVDRLGRLADRMSVNIELPTERSLKLLAPAKDRGAILTPMGLLAERIREFREARASSARAPRFAPAGQSTQLVLGASPEDDLQILRLAEGLYRKYSLRRVYYSAYVPVSTDPRLPVPAAPPLRREHRTYQADWLLRHYGFRAEELLSEERPRFEEDLDPKAAWALRNLQFFPVEVNTAPPSRLLRVPGIGRTSAKRILEARRERRLTPEALSRLGVVMKRARFFLLCDGRACWSGPLDPTGLRARVGDAPTCPRERGRQLLLFGEPGETAKNGGADAAAPARRGNAAGLGALGGSERLEPEPADTGDASARSAPTAA
jgi:putative DNA modification/repair radical SAM protein